MAAATPLAVVFLRVSYTLAATAVLAVNAVPAVRCRFVAYGKTSRTPQEPQTAPERLLDYLGSISVPHSWFTHFYLLSVFSSLFWGAQLCTGGAAYRLLADRHVPSDFAETPGAAKSVGEMSIQQVVLTWTALLLQGIRRSYECLYVQKPGGSRMSALHYMLGIMFYSSIGITVWIEGIGAVDAFDFTFSSLKSLVDGPSIKSFLGITLFIMASGVQHDCHTYLADLKKYSLPEHPAFLRLVCPHYTAECAIYIALTILAAPMGSPINWTFWTALAFVAINLGVSSKFNKEWYEQKFGKDAVKRRWSMIPGIF